LREVDLLACEDTRQTAKLLDHYHISLPLTSYHEHNEREKAGYLLEQLQAGKQVALVSDSGTPCLSDPGYRIVRVALENGIRVVPIPGASAVAAALSASGRPTNEFVFLGFLPSRKGPRKTFLKKLKTEPRTLVVFEAPRRFLESLLDIREILGDRRLTVARELTKIHEEFFFGQISEAYDHFRVRSVKGEIVLILEKGELPRASGGTLNAEEMDLLVRNAMVDHGISHREAIRLIAGQRNVSRRELYQLLVSSKRSTAGGEL
jgi:16S rRNA (cytidine1402-2'-O)-methyltransferase